MFKYIEDCNHHLIESGFIVNIKSNIFGKDSLLEDLYQKLNFPDYFGFNWDALYDSLVDLNWIETNQISIIHYDLPNIGLENINIYLSILKEACECWDNDINDEHNLEIVFPKNLEVKINKIINF